MHPNHTTSQDVPHKHCSRCKQLKPATIEYFYERVTAKDGLRGVCIECRKEQSAQWVKDNPEQARVNARGRMARFRKRNRTLLLERTREWKAKNPDRIKQYMEQWRADNDARLRAERVNQRAEARGLPFDFDEGDWEYALAYFEGRCAVCQRPIHGLFHSASADHWIPLSSPNCPGSIPANIVPLCCGKDGCNDSKNRNQPEEWVIRKYGEKQGHEIVRNIHRFFKSVRQL